MSDQVIPLARVNFGPEEEAAVARVLRSGWVTQGPEVATFEQEFAAFCGARHAVAVSNCTTALHLSLLANDVGPGDEVITVSHSFIATANAIVHAGAVPVFVDIRLDDFNMDPQLIVQAITPQTKAILAVHQVGMPCRLEAIAAVAREHGLRLIEDAACAAGSELFADGAWMRIGKPIGQAACFSFHPRKLLSTGDGGMITTDDDAMAARLRLLRQHAMSVNDQKRHQSNAVVFEEYTEIGFNFRLTDIQAAIGRCQLQRLPVMIARRRDLAEKYQRALSVIPGLELPKDRNDTRTNWQSYCVLLPAGADQRRVMQAMLDAGIATRRGIMNAHREPAYAGGPHAAGIRFPLPQSEAAQDRGLVLPMFDTMTEAQIDRVATTLNAALQTPERKSATC
ncbi:DegT/DnrJ/EryC1/StrS family aminotransferase [Dongia sp.]|uniref:DegT/DnrJ/EryC1/StrS family aminotransferase n=1 Tax=Dongia sp. TaxID=1977262 RepID=UPI0035B1A6FF